MSASISHICAVGMVITLRVARPKVTVCAKVKAVICASNGRHAKENACGCAAGCYTAHAALELYTEVFETAGKLDRLEGFTSEFGADFYQVPHNKDSVELIREDWQVASTLTFGNDELVPTRGGDVVRWKVRTGDQPPLSDGAI